MRLPARPTRRLVLRVALSVGLLIALAAPATAGAGSTWSAGATDTEQAARAGKLEQVGARPLIGTVHGVGYAFCGEAAAVGPRPDLRPRVRRALRR